MTNFIVILVTAGSEKEAETLATTLVDERLAGCVNIIGPVRSIYRWEGKIADEKEWLLVIKSRAELFAAIEERVKALHSYQTPEVIALPVPYGSRAYLQWLGQGTARAESDP